jgi:hypothetical protein
LSELIELTDGLSKKILEDSLLDNTQGDAPFDSLLALFIESLLACMIKLVKSPTT